MILKAKRINDVAIVLYELFVIIPWFCKMESRDKRIDLD